MVKLIVRAVLLLVICGWAGGTWFIGQELETGLRSMIRDDPSHNVEAIFDPFAEPVEPPLLYDRIWLSLVEHRKVFMATVARVNLNLRLAPDQEPVSIPLLLKFHHGPLIFAGGFAVGAARLQVTLDENPTRRNIPPRWGKAAKPEEGAMVTRGVLAFDGAFSGRSWLQEISFASQSINIELNNMQVALAYDAAFSQVLLEGNFLDLQLDYVGDSLKIAKAEMELRASNILDKERYEGVMSAKWSGAELDYRREAKHISSMEFDTEYRLVDRLLDFELSLTAEEIQTAEKKAELREVILDYGEGVAAIGGFPIERVIELWDHYRVWEPSTAALIGDESSAHSGWHRAETLMEQVSSDVSAYASFKLGVDDQELLMRANAEFIEEGGIESLTGVKTLGQLLDHLLADLTYQADGRLMDIPEVKAVIEVASDLEMVEVDEVGASGNVHVRAGEVRVNGVAVTPQQFLKDNFSHPVWPTVTEAQSMD